MTSQFFYTTDSKDWKHKTMGLGDFWLQFNNGKKENLSDIKGDIRRETVNKKYQKIFDFFDTNKNGAIEGKEAEKFIEVISKFAREDKILTKTEAASIFSEIGIKTSDGIDFVGFAQELSEANKKIKTSEESSLPDGSRKVVTNYTNGARFTAVYYPDGELKYTIKELPAKGTSVTNSVNHIVEAGPVIDDPSVNPTLRTVRKVEFSERAKSELRQNFGGHFEETASNILSLIEPFLSDMTVWDRAGIDMRQAFVNGDLTDMFTAEGVKKLEEFLAKAKDDKELGQKLVEMAQNQVGTFEFHLEKDFGIKDFDFEKMENFHQTSTKYMNAKSLKQRVELLNKGLKEVKQLYQNALTKKKGVPNSDKLNSDYDKKFMEVLTEYFNGDEGVAAAFFNTMKEGLATGTKDENEENDVLITILERIQQATGQTLIDSLQGEKFENLESRYKSEFKDIYGVEDNTTEVENIIQTGQEIGGTIKIGAMTTIQILLSALTMGTGNAALIATMSNPLVSYLTTIGTDYALSVAGALSSVNGLTAEKHDRILESTVETAKFIGVGSLSAPLCRFVGNTMAKYTGKLFENGVKTTTGNVTATVVTGENFLQKICSKSANFTGSFGTELGVFTGYEVVTQDEDFDEAAGSQTTMLSQLKVINKFLQTALGKFVQTQSAKGQQKLAEQQYQKFLNDTGLDKAKITRYETPTGTRFSGEINGIKFTGTTEAEIQAKLLYAAALGVNEGVNEGVKEGKILEGGVKDTELTKVANFAERLGETVTQETADKTFLDKISAKFDECKSKVRPDLLQYESYQKRYSDNSKQLLLDIAQIDPECAELIIGRYDSISDLQSIKQSVILDSKLTKQVLSIHKPLSIKERLQGKKTYYSIGYGESILRMVKALQVIPELEKYCNPIDYYVIDKAGDFIAFYGEEYINKNYDELSLNSKYKLYEKLLAERGLQNAVLLNVPQEVLDLFPAIPPCRLKDNTENPNYLVTIKRLHDDIYKKDYKFDANFVQKFNSDLMQFIKDKNSSYVNNLAENFRQILSEIDSKYTKENIEKVLKDFVNDSSIRNLPEVEQRIYILSQILRNNNNNINRELSKNIVKQLGFSEQEVNQVNRLLSAEDYLKNIKNCKTKEGAELLKYQAAFVLGDDNLLNIADKVYNLSKINGLKEDLKQAVFDIKSNNFAMPQTSKDDYLSASTIETINIDGIDYKVPVVYISELTELNSYIHSTGGTTSRGRSLISVDDVLEKLNLFDEASEDNVFCTSYITKDNICVREDGIGLMFEVPTDCQYVGAGYDIGSMVRNSRDLLSEYFLPDTPMQEKVAWGMRDNVDGKHLRQIVSKNIKEIMGITDEQYVQKWDNINKQLNGQRLTIQRLEQIDSEMAQAYKIFLSRANNAQEYKDDSVLRNSKNNSIYNEVWNEFLVSKPKISGIYINAKSIEELRNKKPNLSIESWLKFAQDNNIPIVVLKPKTAKENLSLSGKVSSKVESEIPQTQLYDGKYSRPLTEYDKIGNKVFELKSKDVTENPEKIAELKAEIEVLRKTEPKQAEELQIVLDMFTNPTSVHNVTDAQIDAVVNYLNSHYDNVEKYLTKQSGGIGISGENLGRFGHRIKGEWSTRDKIANYINDSIKKEQKAKEKGQAFTPRTLLDAYQDVRDKYACRTVFKNGNYANHPEIVKILEEGNYSDAAYRKAQLRAAEIQSQPAVEMLKEAMRKAVREGKDLSMMRISNYTSEGGIPIFSEAQLAELKDCGIELGIDVSFIKLASEKDPNTTKMIVDGATTKAQPSGYTALQVNFITKAGEIIEWQYRGERVNKFAEAEHLPYDIRTGKHPWRQYPELETLYKPIADLLAEKNMPKYAYDQLNRYFTDYYNHLRKLELGFESKEPKLEDYEHWKAKDKDGVEREYTFRFDKRLSAKNLEVLHFYGEGIKDGAIAPERALKEYNAEVKYGSKDLPKPEVKAEKQSDRTPEVMNILNSREGLKNIREDIKTQIAGFVGKSKPENQEEIVKLIYKLKNAKERWGEKTQEYTDEQLLQIISVASNPDGTLNLTVLQRICKRMDGGPREDNSKMTRILPMDTKEHNLTRKSDGFYDEELVEIGQKLMYAHKTREEIFRLLKDENGNPVKELTELIKTDKNEDFDDGEMLLNALRSLYTDGRLDLNKVNQMKELVNGGLTIYSASGAMQSGMPADIVKNMPLLAQKGLSRPDINRVVEYLKNNNIEPTFEAVKNTVENCGDIPEFREIHIKHLLSLRGETMAQSAYNNVLNLSERINEYYKRQPELAGKTPDLVSQYIKLLYVEGRTTQLTQREIMDLIGDMANNGTQRYNIDKLVDSGVLRDIPGRRKPLSKNDLLILQKEDIEVLKKAVEKGLLRDEYMGLCNLSWKKHVMVSSSKTKLTRLTELSDTELKNLAYMDWSDLDFTTAISLAKCDPKKVDFVLDVMNIYTVPDYQKILLRDYNVDLAYKLFKEIDPHTTLLDSSVNEKVNDIIGILFVAKPHNIDEINYMYENRTELGITTSQIKDLISNEIKARDIRRLAKKIGKENISKIDERALPVAIRFADYYKVNDINELSAVQKRKLRIKLTECNGNLFDPSVQLLKKHFPLIPQDQTEYCSTMRDIVNSLGIETKPLTETQIGSFNESSLELGQSLGRMSDSDFSNLRITQEYSREDFIKTVLEKTKDLPKSEKLKVYDYFGFELHSNETNPTGYTLTGYPANINNGQKLAKIKSEATRQVVENLRGDVVRFSENNKIKCNDPQTEKLLNQVLETLPELRTMIGRTQHGTHDFDVMQHTLKVLQKITQEPYFEKLNESDKKVVTLAALMHDITKTEGKTDATHATQGSFDGFFISKKYNLTREEGIKMYTLMNMHEWLSFVNKPITDYELNNYIKEYNKNHSKSEQITHLTPDARERLCQEILTKRLQSVAFDLQQDNMFELSLMFTHADLKAVKKDDYFHDTVTMPSCAAFDGKKRVFEVGNGQKVSHGQAADIYAERIRGYVDELKKTRPLTPVTKVPDSETIRSRITQINPDGSTNFKGVFVDKDGLVVIKFNDVEDWEALGFPKGTTTKGIKGTGKIKKEGGDIEESEFETGNFKFFAHALNFANQLSKFDSFALPDSDALLSVTYMERPESKYRNFNTQGIGLYVQSKYVHGGGNTDAGSGTGKSIDEFKKNYIFGGKREKDRTFTADIVKRATGMSDEQYVQFYEKNKNKTWEEVEPIDGSDSVEFRNKLIKAYAENIVSNERGDRAYDEYYVTNPEEPMFAWVYASDKNEKIGANPLEFLHRNNRTDKENKIGRIGHTAIRPVEERTQFLREYCLNRNKVMIVFGD